MIAVVVAGALAIVVLAVVAGHRPPATRRGDVVLAGAGMLFVVGLVVAALTVIGGASR